MSPTLAKIVRMGGDKLAYHRLRLAAIRRKEYGIPTPYDFMETLQGDDLGVEQEDGWELKPVTAHRLYNNGTSGELIYRVLSKSKAPMTSSDLHSHCPQLTLYDIRRVLRDFHRRGVVARRRLECKGRAFEYKVNPIAIRMIQDARD